MNTTTADKLQLIIDSKEDIRQAISEKGVEILDTVPLFDYGDKIREIECGGGSQWQPHPDWWNIEAIFKADPDPNKRFILLLADTFNTFMFNTAQLGNGSAYYKTSDGTTYNANATHTWNKAQDKPCAEGYKTRYIIVYSSNANVACNVAVQGNNTSKYVYFGNNCNIGSFVFGNSTLLATNRVLETIIFDNTVTLLSTGDNTFYQCSSLILIKFPHGLTTIGASVFNSCTALRHVFIPNSVTAMGASGVFSSCYSLLSIQITNGWIAPVLNVTNAQFFPESAAVELFTKLGNVPSARTLTFGTTLLDRWSTTTKAIATNKGYTLA